MGVAGNIAHVVGALLMESITEVVLVTSRASDRILSANLAASELLACELDALVGRPMRELRFEERDVGAAGRYEDFALRRSDGYPIYVELTILHVEEPRHGALAVYIARDTTERRSLQMELLAKHSALVCAYRDLERSNLDLVHAKRQLEERTREIASLSFRATVGEVVANVAHHLNNPVAALTSTVGRLETLVRTDPHPNPECQRLVERAAAVTARVEARVEALVSACHVATRGKRATHPPELADALTSLAEQLDQPPKRSCT